MSACVCEEEAPIEVSECAVVLVTALSDVSGKGGGAVGNIVGFTPVNGMLGKLELKVTLGRREGVASWKSIEWLFPA